MSEEINFVRDLAVILVSAGIFTIISKALKQPVILGYIVAGFLIGPGIEFFPGISSMESVHQWSEIGIIFMMFGLGLEFSFKKLMKSGSASIITSMCKLLGMFLIGFVTGQALGWSRMESMFLGGMLPMSSTMVVAKSYEEMGLKSKPYSGIVFGTLIIEDIMGIILMVLFSTIAVSAKFSGGELFAALGKLAFCLVLWFVVGIYLIPTLLKKARKYLNDEILLIVSIGLCFAMVAMAEKMGFSAALGAFIMGSILAETIESEHIERLVSPIKDLFGAIFFVSVGMMVSPQILAHNWAVILLIVLILLVFDILFVCSGVLLSGKGLSNAIHTGFSLAQMGEFGFIIASVGVGLGVVSDFIYPVIVAVFVVSNLIAPFVIRSADPVYKLLKKRLPVRVLDKIDGETKDSPDSSNAEKSEWKVLIKFYLARIGVYGVILIAVYSICVQFVCPAVPKLFPQLNPTWTAIINCSIKLLAMSPFLYGMCISSGSINKSAKKLLKAKESNKWPILALALLRSFLAIGIVIAVIASHFKLAGWTAVLIIIGGLVFIIVGRNYFQKRFKFEKQFFYNLTVKDQEAEQNAKVLSSVQKTLNGYDVHLEQFEIPSDSSLVGKKLKDIPLRAQSGANIIEIKRGSRSIIIPNSDQVLYPADKVLAVGSSEQIAKMKEMLKEEATAKADNDEFEVVCIEIDKESPLHGKTLRSASLRDYKCMVISVLRGESFVTNPKPEFHFELGDKVWIAGEKSSCEWFRTQ
ncbi:MAG: cation:proton antiporter [Candidatus Cryptobacteroides sp.]